MSSFFSGDHMLRKMNYQKMLCSNMVDSGADVTVATLEVPSHEAAARFGVIETDANWRIVGFEEKPESPKRSHLHPDMVNASMGVYVFNTQLLTSSGAAGGCRGSSLQARFRP